MSEQAADLPTSQNEYIAGAFFGLVTLDIFMFLSHCFLKGTATGYDLSTIVVTLPILLVIYFERLHSHKDH
ncbi:MAG: glucose uptake protein GlcU [Oleiphilaceae bacterium]|jgi:glucose uptake protein GlcU